MTNLLHDVGTELLLGQKSDVGEEADTQGLGESGLAKIHCGSN